MEDFSESDAKIVEYLLSTKHKEAMLATQDEAYNNTLMHIAVTLHAVEYSKALIPYYKANADLL